MTAVSGQMPTPDEFRRFRRCLETSEPGLEFYAVLVGCAGPAASNDSFARSFDVVSGVVVDVDFTARHGHNTGIQRVVRETVKRWTHEHELTLAAWTERGNVMRSVTDQEQSRVVAWSSDMRRSSSDNRQEDLARLLVPWQSRVILPEVAASRIAERLACAAEFSGNIFIVIGYDAIPVTSAADVIPAETERFVRYLSVVKHASTIVGISESSASEFEGFISSLKSQGLSGSTVTSALLPVALPTAEDDSSVPRRQSSIPQILCVGTQEPRKNQLAVLAAAERLWSEGREFELLFIGGAAVPLSFPFDDEVDRLKKRGRMISVQRNVSDAILYRAYVESRFSIFVSLHEGYGLPVGESLSVGTPAITTNYGSMAEIAKGGGCLMVDPRDDQTIATAMATLLDDDDELARLSAEARAREPRTWDDYADELWSIATQDRTVLQ